MIHPTFQVTAELYIHAARAAVWARFCRVTEWPRCSKCQAVLVPMMPAPKTITRIVAPCVQYSDAEYVEFVAVCEARLNL